MGHFSPTSEHEFYCVKCGNKGIPVFRTKNKEIGHLKKLWCMQCKQETNHAECTPYSRYSHDEFLLELNHGNFDKEGNRILPFGIFKDKLMKEGKIV